MGAERGLGEASGPPPVSDPAVDNHLFVVYATLDGGRPVRERLEVDSAIQDPAGQTRYLAANEAGHRVDRLEPCALHPPDIRGPVCLVSGYRAAENAPRSVGVLLASVRVASRHGPRVLPLARITPQDTISVPTRAQHTPRVPQPQCLGDPVPPPVGVGRGWALHHHLPVAIRRPPADPVVLHVGDDLHQCRGARGLRPALHAAQLGAILGWSHQARHAPPKTQDQLSAILHMVGPNVGYRVPRTAGWRLQTQGAHGLGQQEERRGENET